MIDPQLTKVFNVWFDAFGSQWLRVNQLMDRAPLELKMLILRYAPTPLDRHKISRPRVGRWLCRLARGPAISGWHMQAVKASHQMKFSLVEAVLASTAHPPVVRPPGAAIIKVAPGTHPQDALKAAIDQGRQAVLEAMCSGDTVRVQDAEAFLKEIEVAAKQYLDSWTIHQRVEKAWNRHP